MTVTEQYEAVLRLALLCDARARNRRDDVALKKFMARTEAMRQKLDAARVRRECERKSAVSEEHLREELQRILPCHACNVVAGNPLLRCTKAFDCALERCHYRFSPWYRERP